MLTARSEAESRTQTLPSKLDPAHSPGVPDAAERELIAALEALGHALGVAFRAPARTGDLGRCTDPLEAIARASRVRLRHVALRGQWWRQDCGPLLAWLKEGGGERPVALLPGRRGAYDLFDPRCGRGPLDAPTRARLATRAVMVYPCFPCRRLHPLDLPRFAFRSCLRELAVILALAVVTTLLGMTVPVATRALVDEVIPDADGTRLRLLALLLVGTASAQALLSLAQGMATLRAQTRATARVQTAMMDRLLRLPASFFRRFASGDLLNRAMMISQVSQALNVATLRALLSGSVVLFNLILLLVLDTRLAGFAIAVALSGCLATGGLACMVRRRALELERVRGRLFGLVVQLVSAVGKLRVAGAEDRAHGHWAGRFAEQLRLTGSVRALEDAGRIVQLILPATACLALYALAAGRLTAAPGGLTPGLFVSFVTAFGILLRGLSEVVQSLVEVADALARQGLMRPILEAEPECAAAGEDPGPLAGGLSLERVAFRYHPNGPAALDDVSLAARPGEFIALVGPSGSGKSTVLRLLLGMEKPGAGTVTYDNQDLAGLDLDAVRRQLGVVLQSAHVLSGTVFDNVAAGSPVGQDEVWEAVRDAGLAEDVKAMPMGLHTFVAEGGANLSGGQRQRLLLARALLRRPKVLLLDEATSALDNVTQAWVAEALRRRRVTRVVIAHRLSTIRGADRIYVLSEGRVMQEGTFGQLVAQDGLFARMMARQGA